MAASRRLPTPRLATLAALALALAFMSLPGIAAGGRLVIGDWLDWIKDKARLRGPSSPPGGPACLAAMESAAQLIALHESCSSNLTLPAASCRAHTRCRAVQRCAYSGVCPVYAWPRRPQAVWTLCQWICRSTGAYRSGSSFLCVASCLADSLQPPCMPAALQARRPAAGAGDGGRRRGGAAAKGDTGRGGWRGLQHQ